MLTALVTLPLAGAAVVLCLQSRSAILRVTLATSLLVALLSGVVWLQFDSLTLGYQLHSMGLAVDGLSLNFVVLTAYLTPVGILASWYSIPNHVKAFMALQLVIEGILLTVFLVTDLVSFYVAFEAVLIPLFITVGIWGAGTRVRSAMLLFLYTLTGSFCMLLAIVAVYVSTGTTSLPILLGMPYEAAGGVWLGFFLAFAVKTPLMPFHMWLPRAHADAPLAASMILAGTVLKMATYGYLRLCLQLMPVASTYYAPLAQSLAVVSLVYASLATIRQSDVKALIAYSSIGHMAVVVLGLFSGTLLGIEGAVYLALAHGVVSPALFMLAGGVLYDRFHTRTLAYYRGTGLYMPVFATLFFVATACNMGVPLSANWLGEFATLAGLYERSPFICLLGCSGIVLSSLYATWLWVRVVGGGYSQYLTWTTDVNRREYVVLVSLLAPAILFGVYADPVVGTMHATYATLVA